MIASLSSHSIEGAGFRLVETRFKDLPGFAEEDHRDAWGVFMRSASAILENRISLRKAVPPDAALLRLCRSAAAGPPGSSEEARRLFESAFVPHRVVADDPHAPPGFVTGYYEPEVEGALAPSADFAAPILARPEGLDRIGPGVASDPYLDRAAIEARIETFSPVVWLRDWVEVFLVHVQGSARVRLPDGRRMRLVYDGRNGQAYTSIGRRLVETGAIPSQEMSLARLKAWLRAAGQRIGEPGRALMQANRSYIFFRAEFDAPEEGPIGGGGIPLAPLRSIAVDRTIWSYGLPFFIEAELPWRDETVRPFRRLMVTQDTGSAILGPARADLFFGTGDAAGDRAGAIRHSARFTVLLPLPDSMERDVVRTSAPPVRPRAGEPA